ncbi:MAG: hypothetical protein QOH88_1806 [Verrucomicrobiota bacterium]|jgi:hypothetical protein
MSVPEANFVEPHLSFSLPGEWNAQDERRGAWTVYTRIDRKMELITLGAPAIAFDSVERQRLKINETLRSYHDLTKQGLDGPSEFGDITFLMSRDGLTTIGYLEYRFSGPPLRRGCCFTCTSSTTFAAFELNTQEVSEADFLRTIKVLAGSISL